MDNLLDALDALDALVDSELRIKEDTTYTLGLVIGAWVRFRRSHDLNSKELHCCEISQSLFDAMNRLEQLAFGKTETKPRTGGKSDG